MKEFKFVILLLLLILFSCRNERRENEKPTIPPSHEWQGKQIVFPTNLVFTRYATDTTDFRLPQSEYKILIYSDSVGCTPCKLQLHKWKEFMEYTDSIAKDKVSFLFFFHPKDRIEIHYLLKSNEIDRSVCVDIDDRLNKLNHFPTDTIFQTFLLDRNNTVILSGNPINNTDVKELYLKQITGNEKLTKNILKTTAEVAQTKIDLGTFSKSKIKETTFELKNTGNNLLVIVDAITTCGCTAVTYNKQPAKPGENLRIKIKITPKDTGFFDEMITIKFNSSNNQPVKVKIKGNVR